MQPIQSSELDRASLTLPTAWNSGQPLSQQYTSTQYYCSNTIRWFSSQGKQSGTLLENYQIPQKSVLSSLSSPVLILPALAPEQSTKKTRELSLCSHNSDATTDFPNDPSSCRQCCLSLSLISTRNSIQYTRQRTHNSHH